jgi:calcineurin-like phosphoesterase family protein
MDEAIIRNINRVVKHDDELWHLGDFAMGTEKDISRYRHRINCQNIFVVTGNHDKQFRKPKVRGLFSGVYTNFLERKFGSQRITLCHYAMRVWNKSHHGAWHLYGHSHGSIPDDVHARSFDVGVDLWEYTPLSLDEVGLIMDCKSYKPVDHHGSREDFDAKCKWHLYENQQRLQKMLVDAQEKKLRQALASKPQNPNR